MSKLKITYTKTDVLFIIHNECIYHVKNMSKYWGKKKKRDKVTVTFLEK